MIKLFRKFTDWLADRKLRKSALQFIACEADRTFEKPPAWVKTQRQKIEAHEKAQAVAAIREADPTLAAMLADAPEPRSLVGEYWKNTEEQQVVEAYGLGATMDQLVTITGRSRGGVIARLVHLGLINRLSSNTLIDRESGLEVLQ